jgi:hypothetical protein
MANNQKKLKAFVRYDGSGRVVAGSLILRKNRPRVGRWFEIPTYDCCNDTTSSTTTAAPTSFTKASWANVTEACSTTTTGNVTFYSSASSLSAGISIFTDSGLTTPVTEGLVISDLMTMYLVNAGGVLSVYNCV